MFIPELGATVAELPSAVKNQRSHRALAAQRLRELWPAWWPPA
jgi:inosine/xanthosine triphosphate pyrophosphatase family protein